MSIRNFVGLLQEIQNDKMTLKVTKKNISFTSE